jgi:hypothetical protein
MLIAWQRSWRNDLGMPPEVIPTWSVWKTMPIFTTTLENQNGLHAIPGNGKSLSPQSSLLLRRDKGFQGKAIGDHQSRAALLDKMLLLETREEPADGFP